MPEVTVKSTKLSIIESITVRLLLSRVIMADLTIARTVHYISLLCFFLLFNA